MLVRPQFPRSQSLPKLNLRPNCGCLTENHCQEWYLEIKPEYRGTVASLGFLLFYETKNMKFPITRVSLAGPVFVAMVFVAMASMAADSANAQYSTCSTPTVAYQPVIAQPVATTQYQVAQYAGWYPGKLLDRWRLRNYGLGNYGMAAPVAPTYTPYTASYAPYTASYPTYTAGYTPYVTAYAPLRRTVVARPIIQTSYYAASPCSSCVQTVARPVVLSPVVHAGCSTCAVPNCGGCSACSTIPMGVSQATFNQPAGCSGCATSPAIPSYSPAPSLAPSSPSRTVGPPTPQPQLSPSEPAPARSNYPDPSPQKDLDTSTSFESPQLFDPNDRTAQRLSSDGPTVGVWNAVYHKSTAGQIKQTRGKPARTQAEIDAEGWQSIPRSH